MPGSEKSVEDTTIHLSELLVNNGHVPETIIEEDSAEETIICQEPIIYSSTDAPLCGGCKQLDLLFFDPDCSGCLNILRDPATTIPQLFAIIRQWTPQTQQKIDILAKEIISRGCHLDSRDGLTDMSLLHYACKSGANGVGDSQVATKTVAWLLDQGADPTLRCGWTDMAPIHYATYFDVSPVLELLLKAGGRVIDGLNEACREFEGGTPLHIAATNLCLEAATLLVRHGASLTQRDSLGRMPLECIPEMPAYDSLPDLGQVVTNLYDLLTPEGHDLNVSLNTDYSTVTGRAVLKAAKLSLGDRVCTTENKFGILRYCGSTHFACGLWAGIDLEEPLGKNDGTVKGVSYFKCPPNHGLFVPMNKIVRPDRRRESPRATPPRMVNHPKVKTEHVTPKVETGLGSLKRKSSKHKRHRSANGDNGHIKDLVVGERVLVASRKRGTLRYVGETEFAAGIWYGVELDKALGKNDGSLQDRRYFNCPTNHGIFAPSHRISRLVNEEDIGSDHGSSCDLTNSVSRSSTDFSPSPASCYSPASPRKAHNKSAKVKSSSPTANQQNCWLTLGVNVFVNNEIGVVRYLGPVDFAEGTWLGVELRTANGKNDGCVQGKRYFTCRSNHGLLVRPSRVTIRGINGAKLLLPKHR